MNNASPSPPIFQINCKWALLRVEGYSVEEIAKRLNFGKRPIERKLKLIRSKWQQTVDDFADDEDGKGHQ